MLLLNWQAAGLLTFKISPTNIFPMNNILQIRKRLGLSQAAFGEAIGVSRGTSRTTKKWQEVPLNARRVIAPLKHSGMWSFR